MISYYVYAYPPSEALTVVILAYRYSYLSILRIFAFVTLTETAPSFIAVHFGALLHSQGASIGILIVHLAFQNKLHLGKTCESLKYLR